MWWRRVRVQTTVIYEYKKPVGFLTYCCDSSCGWSLFIYLCGCLSPSSSFFFFFSFLFGISEGACKKKQRDRLKERVSEQRRRERNDTGCAVG